MSLIPFKTQCLNFESKQIYTTTMVKSTMKKHST